MAADSYRPLVNELEATEEARSADATPVSRLALSDGAIALAALSLFAAAEAWCAASGLSADTRLAVLDGLAVGYGLGLLAHERGHFAGARWGGGIVAHWSLALLLLTWVPLDAPGRVALACGAFAFACGASTTELPVIRRSFAGASPVESFAGLTGAKLRRNRWIGYGAGGLLVAALV